MLSDEEEILDVVDHNDQVIGTISHEEVYDHSNLHGNFVRASNAFLVNSKGQLWIPRRQPHKKIAPNGLDFSMGEHVQSGETYIDAAVRGFEEELHMTIASESLTYFGAVGPEKGLAPYFTHNFFYKTDDDPDFEQSDYVSAEWLGPNELIKRLEGGESSKTSLKPTVELFLRYQAEHVGDKNRN